MKKNPFEELGITIKPKALFRAYSNEANQVGVEKRIEALAKIIYAGYNLKEVADGYLQGKDAATDKVAMISASSLPGSTFACFMALSAAGSFMFEMFPVTCEI